MSLAASSRAYADDEKEAGREVSQSPSLENDDVDSDSESDEDSYETDFEEEYSSSEYEEVEVEIEVAVDSSGQELAMVLPEEGADAVIQEHDDSYYVTEEIIVDEMHATDDGDAEYYQFDKAMKQYEVMSELIEEQKARTFDLFRFLNDDESTEQTMEVVEERNDNLMQSIHAEFGLDNSPDTDEADVQWEVYNSVVKNFNEYLEAVAEFLSAMDEQRHVIDALSLEREQWEERTLALAQAKGGAAAVAALRPVVAADTMEQPSMTEDEIEEMQELLARQSEILQSELLKKDELETALQNVFTEYMTRVSDSNGQIQDLHSQLETQHKHHQTQLDEMQRVYDRRIREVEQASGKERENQKEMETLLGKLHTGTGEMVDGTRDLYEQLLEEQRKHDDEQSSLSEEIERLKISLAASREERDMAELDTARMDRDLGRKMDEMIGYRKRVDAEYNMKFNAKRDDELSDLVDAMTKDTSEVVIDDDDEFYFAVTGEHPLQQAHGGGGAALPRMGVGMGSGLTSTYGMLHPSASQSRAEHASAARGLPRDHSHGRAHGHGHRGHGHRGAVVRKAPTTEEEVRDAYYRQKAPALGHPSDKGMDAPRKMHRKRAEELTDDSRTHKPLPHTRTTRRRVKKRRVAVAPKAADMPFGDPMKEDSGQTHAEKQRYAELLSTSGKRADYAAPTAKTRKLFAARPVTRF